MSKAPTRLPGSCDDLSIRVATFKVRHHSPLVIPTGANPDFLLRAASPDTCAAPLRESRMLFLSATTLNRKSGGAQWKDLLFLPQPCSTL
jgi:hypothetical protein